VQMLLAVRRALTAEQLKRLRDLRRIPPLQASPGFGPPEGAPGPPPGGPPQQPDGAERP
jgi:hypothetical protein